MGGWQWFVWEGGSDLYGRVAVICMHDYVQGGILTVVRKDVGEVSCLNHEDFHAEIR